MGGVPGPVSPSCGDPPALRATSCRRKTEGAGRMSHTRHNTKRRFLCVPQLGERAAGKLAVAGARSRGTYSLGGAVGETTAGASCRWNGNLIACYGDGYDNDAR